MLRIEIDQCLTNHLKEVGFYGYQYDCMLRREGEAPRSLGITALRREAQEGDRVAITVRSRERTPKGAQAAGELGTLRFAIRPETCDPETEEAGWTFEPPPPGGLPSPPVLQHWAHRLRNAMGVIEGSAEIVQLMAYGRAEDGVTDKLTDEIVETAGEIRAASRKVEEIARELVRAATRKAERRKAEPGEREEGGE